MSTVADRARARRPFYFMPDELCVVLTLVTRGEAELPGGGKDWRDLYEAVRDALDGVLRDELRRTSDEGVDNNPLRRDLDPRALRAIADPTKPLLTDLRRGQSDRPTMGRPLTGDPWIILPRSRGVWTALFFFSLATGDHHDDPEGQALVREAVNLCNRSYRRRTLGLDGTTFAETVTVRVEAGTPNWLMGAAQHGHIEGGPGSGPLPVPPSAVGGASFGQFTADGRAALADLLPPSDRPDPQQESSTEREVVVAILDTCPTDGKRQIKEKLDGLPGDHWLLHELHDSPHVHFGEPPSIGPTDPSTSWEYSVNWGRWSAPYHAHHEMPDHGLFVTGIIRTLAPDAEIHLIRVLDDFGVGDLLTLAQVLAQLPERLLATKSKPRRLIVNLSLTAALPPDADLLDFWFPKTAGVARNRAIFRRHFADICATVESIQLGLRAVIDWLATRDDVLLVAAAGNDGQHQGGRPAPAAPARYDCVLGVGALATDGSPARFSNRADIAVFGNGVAIFGGNVEADTSGDLGVIATGANKLPDAVVGAAIAPTLPPDGAPNETGWARWAGTSFAAPIVSGLAASLWARPEGRDLAAPALLHALVDLAATPLPELDCPAITIGQIN